MKHGSFKVVCFIVLACVTVLSGFGDNVSVDLEGKVLETFNGDSEYNWKAIGSKFATKTDDMTFPRISFVDAWPIAAFGLNRDGSQTIKSLGIHGRFDRQEYNWIDVYPVKADDTSDSPAPAEIPMPGRVRSLDMWVWGSNLNLYVEAFVRDHLGVIHAIRMGDINYTGWRNLRVTLPGSIPQEKRQLPRLAGLTLVKFRIWTLPRERVGDFYVYFKQFKILTDMFETYYDGDDLGDPEQVERLWATATK